VKACEGKYVCVFWPWKGVPGGIAEPWAEAGGKYCVDGGLTWYCCCGTGGLGFGVVPWAPGATNGGGPDGRDMLEMASVLRLGMESELGLGLGLALAGGRQTGGLVRGGGPLSVAKGREEKRAKGTESR
jgi:hypothetical protein